MTYKVHGFVDNKMIFNVAMEHLPRNGDTIRIKESSYAKITEVVWCFDEDNTGGQRVNLRMESEK
jgi:hypothetical protein